MKKGRHLDSAHDIASRIARRELRAVDAVERAIERIEQVNPALNALVADRYERARAEARALDEELAADGAALITEEEVLAKYPLCGVPFVARESLAVEGLPQTAGLVARTGSVASEDATVIRRLRDAGAILLGVTNPAELGFWLESDNLVYGRTVNPHAPLRTAGGDGGGDAALVAAGCVPFAVGTDVTGGNRVPAAFCGVYGLKPSAGLAPTTGLFPTIAGRMRWYTSMGALAHDPADLGLLLPIVAGPDGEDPTVEPYLLRNPADVDFTWRRVLVCADPGFPGLRPSAEVRRGVERAASLLAGYGAEIESWRPEQFPRAAEIWLAMVHEAFGLYHSFEQVLGEGQRVSLVWERLRAAVGLSRYTRATLAMVLWERATKNVYVRIQRQSAEGRRLRERLNLLLADGGVLVLPVWPTTAPRPGRTRRHTTAIGYTGIFNVLGLPALSVPLGTGRGGLPLAVQVVAAQGRDDVCIAAAQHLAQRSGGTPVPKLRRLITSSASRA